MFCNVTVTNVKYTVVLLAEILFTC